jgi:hypothetical protein
VLYGVDRLTITRAVHQIRPLLARRGFAVPDAAGVRLHTLADVFAYAAAHGSNCASTAPRPGSAGLGPPGQGGGRSSPARSSRTPSRPPPSPTATAGPCGLGRYARAAYTTRPRSRPRASKICCASVPPSRPRSTAATRAWPRRPPTRSSPASKPSKDAAAEQITVYEAARKQRPSRRICVKHAIAEPTRWRSLQRWIGRREYYAQTHLAVAGLASDRAARR